MPKVHNEQNPNRLYDHETCIYSNTYCSKWYKKRTSCQNDGKLVPGNLSYLLSGFCNVTCLRGKFEDECRVDRVLSPPSSDAVTQPPPPHTRAVDPESGKQGGEHRAESNNISTPNIHISSTSLHF